MGSLALLLHTRITCSVHGELWHSCYILPTIICFVHGNYSTLVIYSQHLFVLYTGNCGTLVIYSQHLFVLYTGHCGTLITDFNNCWLLLFHLEPYSTVVTAYRCFWANPQSVEFSTAQSNCMLFVIGSIKFTNLARWFY